MGETITTRVDDKEAFDIRLIEKEEKLDRSAVVRRLLSKAVLDWKIEKALKQYKEKKITMGKVAEIIGLPLRETLAIASSRGIAFQYSVKDLEEDFKEAIK